MEAPMHCGAKSWLRTCCDVSDSASAELVTDELERRDDLLRLKEAFNRVPVRERRVLLSHFVEGLSIRATAQREGVPFGTVLSRIHRGKQLLRDALNASSAGLASGASARESVSSKPSFLPGFTA
jgi:DNA-directed RNA polymerase specialized sigma24 family protein